MKKCCLLILCVLLTALAFSETAQSSQEQADFTKILGKANKGDPAAMFTLGNYYLDGYGVKQDSTKGYEFVKQAAAKGNADAQYMWGRNLISEIEDHYYDETIEWWRKAAAQGLVDAQYSMGQLYESGLSVPQSDSTAVYWFRQAANKGLTDAIFSMSQAYSQGKGVPQDYKEAYFWILLAFPERWDAGYASVENVAYHLSDAEISTVRKRATQWLSGQKSK